MDYVGLRRDRVLGPHVSLMKAMAVGDGMRGVRVCRSQKMFVFTSQCL